MVLRTSPDINPSKLSSEYIFTVKSEKHQHKKRIESLRIDKVTAIVKFLGVDSIEQAYKLVGYEVYIDNPPLDFSRESYTGYSVRDREGNDWGAVEGFERDDMTRIIRTNLKGRIFLIPFATSIVIDIDKKARIITIDPPEGLRELNL